MAQIPAKRILKRPYFLIRTADGRNHYFRYEIVRAIFHSSDPIARFLPKGEVAGKPDAKAQSGGDEPALVYDFARFELEDPQPLEFLSDDEIDAFAEAVDTFLLRTGGGGAVSAYERDLREHFKLPDPRKEPDCYWTYGPKKGRKLLILHGAEFEPETSISLDGVVGYLRENCQLPWGHAQDHVLERMQETGEPLSRIVARRSPAGFQIGNTVIPESAVKPLRRFPPKVTESFRIAAADFYQRAHSERCESASEREWRSQFKLPDPQKRAGAYLMAKHETYEGLLVVLEESELEENCLPLIADPAIPETTQSPANIADRMSALKPSFLPLIAGGIAALVLIVGGLALAIGSDREGPAIDPAFGESGIFAQDQDGEDDARTVRVKFNEALDPASLVNAAGESQFVIREDRSNLSIPLASPPEIVGEAGDQVMLKLSRPLLEDVDYRLDVEAVGDLAGNMAGPIRVDFEFEDTLPPALHAGKLPTAEGNALTEVRFFFSDELDANSVTNPRNYRIEPIVRPGESANMGPLRITAARLNEDGRSITIQVDGVDSPFEESREYRARIAQIEDTAGNEVDDEAPIEVQFAYIDTLPPTLDAVTAAGNQYEVTLSFDEPVNPVTARIGDYLTVMDEADRALKIRRARLSPTNDQILVELEQPLVPGTDYRAVVRNVPDRAADANVQLAEASVPFTYTGNADTVGPAIFDATAFFNRVTVLYDEAIDPRVAQGDQYSRFSMTDENGVDYTFIKAEMEVQAKPNQIRLTTAESIPEDTLLTLRTPGVTDRSRNVGDKEGLKMTFASGTMGGALQLEQAVYEPVYNQVRLKFNRRPSRELVNHPEWIEFGPPLQVDTITADSAKPKEIIVKVSDIRADTIYQVTISDELTDLGGGKPSSKLRTQFRGPVGL